MYLRVSLAVKLMIVVWFVVGAAVICLIYNLSLYCLLGGSGEAN